MNHDTQLVIVQLVIASALIGFIVGFIVRSILEMFKGDDK